MTNNLRRLLVIAASNPETMTAVPSPLRQALREICESPDSQAEKPERLLIAFKLSLTEAADDASIFPGPERTRLLDHVVTLFIEELYRLAEGSAIGQGNGRQVASRNSIPSGNPGLNGALP